MLIVFYLKKNIVIAYAANDVWKSVLYLIKAPRRNVSMWFTCIGHGQ